MPYQSIGCPEFIRRLTRTRNPQVDIKLDTPLKRCLGIPQLTLYCIAHMIGAGLYVLTGRLIKDYTGTAAPLAYLTAAITSVFTAFCYAEFTTIFPRAGSAYLYTYLMLGELIAFLIGWAMLSDMIVSTASVAKAFSGTIDWLTNGTIYAWEQRNLVNIQPNEATDLVPDLLAGLFLVLLIFLTMTGADFSLSMNVVFSSIQVLCLIAITIGCFVVGSPSYSFQPQSFLPFGISGLLSGSGLAIFGFSGFEAVANASEEAKNPSRDIPIAMFAALIICVFLYTGATTGLVYIIPWAQTDYKSPFVAAFSLRNQVALIWLSAIAVLLSTGASKIVSMFVIPRLFFSMASDGLLFKFMAYVEPCCGVPIISLLIGGLITVLLAVFIKIQVLAEFSSIGIVFCYFIIGIDLMYLKYINYPKLGIDYSYGSKSEQLINASSSDMIGLTEPRETVRLRPKASACLHRLENRFSFQLILWIYAFSAIGMGTVTNFGLKHDHLWTWSLWVVFFIVALVTFILLCQYEPVKFQHGFQTPLMPVAPCMTILTNGVLIACLPALTWLRFLIWSALGLIIYFCYGIWFSKADESQMTETDSQDIQPNKDSYQNIDDVLPEKTDDISMNYPGEKTD